MSIPPRLTQVCRVVSWAGLRLLVVKLSSTMTLKFLSTAAMLGMVVALRNSTMTELP